MSLGPYRPVPIACPPDGSIDAPPVPIYLVGLLLILTALLAIVFIVAAQVIQTL